MLMTDGHRKERNGNQSECKAMSTKFKYTKRKIESLTVTDKTVTYHDTETTGLKLTLSKAGTYIFLVYRKIKGRPERIKLGNFLQ